jgi:hypothetical protein
MDDLLLDFQLDSPDWKKRDICLRRVVCPFSMLPILMCAIVQVVGLFLLELVVDQGS